MPAQDVHRAVPGGPARAAASRRGCGSSARPRSPTGASPRRRRPGTPGCPGPSRTARSRPGRTRCWTRRRPRSRTWASTSTGAAGPGGERDAETGQYVQLADRWHVNFCDLSGRQGMLGQVEGRTADDAAYWLLQAPPAWRDRVEVVAIDMCTVFLSAVRRALPKARVAVDLFHVVQLAVKATGRRAPPRHPGEVRAAGKGRRPRVRAQGPAQPQPGEPVPGPVRQGHRDPGRRRARPADRDRLDREGEAARRPEPAREIQQVTAVRAAGPRPALRLLRLVRPERGHPRARHASPRRSPAGRSRSSPPS